MEVYHVARWGRKLLVCGSLLAIALGGANLFASELLRPRCCQSCTPSGSEEAGDAASPDAGTPDTITPGDEAPDLNSSISNDFGAASGPESASPHMLGDFLATSFGTVTFQDASVGVFVLQNTRSPFGRSFKVAENQSARPQDRIFADFNYFQASGVNIQRFSTGFEKRVLEGQASFGLKIPYYTDNPDPLAPPRSQFGDFGASPASESAAGDLTTIFKYAPYMDRISGDTLTLGLAITAPTGSGTLAGVEPLYTTTVKHRGSIQPFVGYLLPTASGWFLQGFSSIDAPFSSGDTTWWFNDVSIGKYINRGDNYVVSAIIPTMEVHVNSPIGGDTIAVTGFTPAASGIIGVNSGPVVRAGGTFQVYNQVNLNTAITFELNRRSTLALGLVTPLVETGRPFNSELQVQFNTFGIGSGPRYRSW